MRKLSLLLAAMVMISCGGTAEREPDLPQSVSPGWSRSAMTKQDNECWQTEYKGAGSAVVTACRYSETVAFEKMQRTPASGDTVKFQQGKYFVLVKWADASRSAIAALVRAIQKSLQK